jgi:hypothetical protein
MIFKRFTWRCARGDWHDAETIEPVDWTGGMDPVVGGRPPECNPRYRAAIMPETRAKRRGSSGTTLSGAISVGGFTGSASSTTSEVVRQHWVNAVSHSRDLCGSSAQVDEHTRVYSFA